MPHEPGQESPSFRAGRKSTGRSPVRGAGPDGLGDGRLVLGGPGEAELPGAGVHAQLEHALAGDLGVVEHDLDGQAVDQFDYFVDSSPKLAEVKLNGEEHLIVAAMLRTYDAMKVKRPRGLRLSCVNRIPHARGLGSSAAATGTRKRRAPVRDRARAPNPPHPGTG